MTKHPFYNSKRCNLSNNQANDPSSLVLRCRLDDRLDLDCGKSLAPLTIGYQKYGILNRERNNVVLVCHALTGDQHIASPHPTTGKPGWWDIMVGAGKPIDTDKFCVICSNVLGGCMGTTGPATINPASAKPYALDFPVITISDMVNCQAKLLDYLGIDQLLAVIGGSMGGMQALQWAASYPERLRSAVIIASAAHHSPQNIAFHEVGRQAILADRNWCGGHYLEAGVNPDKGLAVARMAAHITYMSSKSLHDKFGRNLQAQLAPAFSFDGDFQIESYLRHQGMTFVDRFDANSYLYLTRAMDLFDLAHDHGGTLVNAFDQASANFCLVSFTSDWLFPTAESRAIVHALNAAGAKVSFIEIDSTKGHDSFLLDLSELKETIRGFLGAIVNNYALRPA